MSKDNRKSPQDLGMKSILGELAGTLKEESALQAEVEALHAVVYSAPPDEVAVQAEKLGERLKGRPGTGRYPYDLIEAARQVLL